MIILNTPTQTIELLPTDRTKIGTLKTHLITAYKVWIQNGFDVASTVADDDAWTALKACVNLLPRKDNPAVAGADLEAIGNDYQQLEQLFFVGTLRSVNGQWDVEKLDLDEYTPPAIVRAHLLNGKRLLFEADRLRQNADAVLQSPD